MRSSQASSIEGFRSNLGFDFPISVAHGGTGCTNFNDFKTALGISFPISVANGGTGKFLLV